MSSIQFAGTEILTSAYIPQFAKHESAPDRAVVALGLVRDDGDVLISERYGKKIITLRGTLKAATQDALDEAIDDFKELFSRSEKNLDISWNGGTRRYVATCIRHEFNRDHYHTNAVPWTAEFVVSNGVGNDTSDTIARNEASLTTSDSGSTGDFTVTDSFSLDGSKPPQPVITIEIVSVGDDDMLGIEYENTDTGERIIITRNVDWQAASGKQIIIDCANKKVTDNLASSVQVEGPFYGVFPRFKLGTNDVRIRSGGIVNQQSSDTSIPNSASSVNTTSTAIRYAMSFQVPYTDATFCDITLGLSKVGSPGSALLVAVVSDNSGVPNLANTIYSGSIAAANISADPVYTYVRASNGAGATLQANTTYWLVAWCASGVDGSNYYRWHADAALSYPRGAPLLSTNSGSSWITNSAVPSFRILIGGLSAACTFKHSVHYKRTFL